MLRNGHQALALEERPHRGHLLLGRPDQLVRRRVARLGAAPRLARVAVDVGRHARELLLRGAQLAQRDPQQLVGRHVQAFVEAQLALETLPSEAERGAALRGHRGAQVLDAGAQRVQRLHRRVGQVAQQVQVVQVAERARQVPLDEAHHAFERLEAHLDEQARRVADVVARGREQPRHLAELRAHAARPLREGRVGEENLSRQAGRQRVGIEERAALPLARLLEREQAAADAVAEHPAVERLRPRQSRRADAVEPARPPAELPDARGDGVAPEILEQVVVGVYSVGGRFGRVDLVEVREELLGEVGQRFRYVGGSRPAHQAVGAGNPVVIYLMVQYRRAGTAAE